jgi:RimJ/RimL family protein N-acetyltransferase
VAERAGFIREAVLRSYMQAREDRQDMVAYRLLAGEGP